MCGFLIYDDGGSDLLVPESAGAGLAVPSSAPLPILPPQTGKEEPVTPVGHSFFVQLDVPLFHRKKKLSKVKEEALFLDQTRDCYSNFSS